MSRELEPPAFEHLPCARSPALWSPIPKASGWQGSTPSPSGKQTESLAQGQLLVRAPALGGGGARSAQPARGARTQDKRPQKFGEGDAVPLRHPDMRQERSKGSQGCGVFKEQ